MTTQASDLLVNGDATGDWVRWMGGRGALHIEGTPDGATISLQTKGPNGTPVDVGADTTVTTLPAVADFELGPCDIRIAVTGGAAPAGIYARAVGIPRH